MDDFCSNYGKYIIGIFIAIINFFIFRFFKLNDKQFDSLREADAEQWKKLDEIETKLDQLIGAHDANHKKRK